MGYSLSLKESTVTVDGAPASLIPADNVTPVGFGNQAALIDPAPAAGQEVVISGTFCPQEQTCPPATISFVTSAPDTTAPAAPSSMTFDIHDYADFKAFGGSCQSDSDLAWWITTIAEPAAKEESLVILAIEGFRDEAFTDLAFSSTSFLDATFAKVGVRQTINILNGEAAPEAFCIRATTSDAAGNKAAKSISSCRPCKFKVENEPTMSPNPPMEPVWAAADTYPGGTCDPGGGAGGAGGGAGAGVGGGGGNGGEEDDTTTGGCGCRVPGEETGGGAAGAAGLLALSVVGLGLSRRRRS
jgi:MYXO-CTERM domain-containing protein